MAVRIQRQDGFTLIELLLVCGLIGIISAMALPRLLMAKQAADASSAIGSLRTLNTSEMGFAASCGAGYYAPDLVTLGVAPLGSNVPFISPDLSAAAIVTKSGYTIQMSGQAVGNAPASCNGLAAGAASQGFKAAADPFGPSNYRFFGTNTGATIYEDTLSLYAVIPESGPPPSGQPLE